MTKKIVKITVIRTTVSLTNPDYRVIRINGVAQIEVPTRLSSQLERAVYVGDSVTHEELKRLCSVRSLGVTVLASGHE